jgi:hypothetical protein
MNSLMAAGVVAIVSCLTISAAAPVPPSFLGRRDTGFLCGAFAAADVNSDGKMDLVCGGGAVALGNGKGEFNSPAPAVAPANSFIVIDFNGDGKLDLVFAGAENMTTRQWGAAVALGNGDGTFQSPVYYPTTDNYELQSIVVADFNRDGMLDVATVGSQGVWLFLGSGNGQLQQGLNIPLTSRGNPGSYVLAGGDFNGDGFADLIANTQWGFELMLGNGDGTFQSPVQYSAPLPQGSTTGISVGDLNRDGRPDVVLASGTATSVAVFLNRGNESFGTASLVPIIANPMVALADVNGDGILDLVSPSVYIALGKGDGTFQTPVYWPVSDPSTSAFAAQSVLVADLRKPGVADIVAGTKTTSILLNSGKGKFRDGLTTAFQGGLSGCAISADYNGDGIPDLAVAVAQGVSVLFGTGTASKPFIQGPITTVANSGCLAGGDINNDGRPDLLAASFTGTGQLIALLGNGDGTFTVAPPSTVPALGYPALGDFNGDGKLDYALSTNYLALGNGDGTFQAPAPFVPKILPQTRSFYGVTAADLNGDGLADILLTDAFGNYLYVLLATPTGVFQETTISTEVGVNACNSPDLSVVADLNGDGAPDVVLGCVDGRVPIYINDGKGNLQLKKVLTETAQSDFMVPRIADLNGDGIPDIAVLTNYTVAVFTGLGKLNYSAPVYWGAGPQASDLTLMNALGQPGRSGKADIVLPDTTGLVYTLLNTTP